MSLRRTSGGRLGTLADRLIFSILLSSIGLSSLAGPAHAKAIPAAGPAAGETSWIRFYVRDFPEGRLTYLYDPSALRMRGDTLEARWKVIGSRRPTATYYRIEIACRDNKFTEKGTLLIEAGGRAREIPASELLVDQPIETGTSADVFRTGFCR